ncbi:MAG: hemerythrin domain-containing protein [Candidatus Bathyarchaeota archaeon]|nr:hemerythrin domain-containing protein [Candidatus Bathyarchaeota archaeon]
METELEKEVDKEKQKLKENATIYDLLKLEHKDVKKLFKQIVENESYQDNVYSQIKKALTLHMEGEEKLLYPRLENDEETRSSILEAYEEHDVAKKVMNDIEDSSDNDARVAKVKVLSDVVDHHVEEEEGELFKKARKILSTDDEREIARKFMDEKMAKM